MTLPYIKTKSFERIKHPEADRNAAVSRIEEACGKLAQASLTDYQAEILRQACHDIGTGSSSDAEDLFSPGDLVVQDIIRLSDDDLPRYLFYRYRYDMFPRKHMVDDFPPCLQVEPASVCNYRCVFCYQTDKEFTDPKSGHMGMMKLDLFQRIIDQAEGQCEAVTLASRGEPLLNPRIKEMLAYAGGKFLALKLNTNAFYLTEDICHAILQAGVNILVFSVDAASEPLYSRLRVRGDLERVVSNIRQFHRIRLHHYPQSRTLTRVSGVKFCEDQDFESVEAFWRGYVDQVAFVTYNPWENTYQKPPNDIDTPCSDLWRRMFVWFDGTVNTCDIDYRSTMAIGSAKTERITDIWKGDRYSVLREAHLAGQRRCSALCRQCTFT